MDRFLDLADAPQLPEGMEVSNRSEYFAILAALCVTDNDLSPKKVAEFALRIWDEGDSVASLLLDPDDTEDGE